MLSEFNVAVAVIGMDIDEDKVTRLNRGENYIKHISSESISATRSEGGFMATADSVVICVPTPLSKNRESDISYVLETGRVMAPYLRPGILVVLESTTYPGAIDEDLREVNASMPGYVVSRAVEPIDNASKSVKGFPSAGCRTGLQTKCR